MSQTRSLDALLGETGWIHALARRLVADPHLAADLAQETCIEALDAQPSDDRSLRGWLATVMRNHLSKLRRGDRNRTSREQHVSRDEADASALDVVEKAETHRNVVLAVLALEEPYRTTLLMRFFEQLSYAEIARRTGVTRASVNSRITRGLERLRQRLESTYGGDRRALSLALIPLATSSRVATTLFGVKTMHLLIGTTAATLLALTVTVGLNRGDDHALTSAIGERPIGADVDARDALSAREPIGVELQAPPADERERGAPAPAPTLAAVASAAKEPAPIDQRAPEVWKTEVSKMLTPATTVESVAVNTGSGDIELADSPSGVLEIQAKVRAEVGVADNRSMTPSFDDHVEVVEDKGVLRIEDRHRNSRGWTVSFVVHVPGRLAAQLNTGSGDLNLRRAAGKVTMNTGSGDIEVRLATDRVESVKANTGSGDIEVEVAAIDGRMDLNTGSGDVTLRVLRGDSPGAASLNAGSGDVGLVVPPDVSASFDLETNGDAIELSPQLGIQVREDAAGRKRAQGTVGGGAAKYVMRSGSGDIKLQAGEMMKKRRSASK